MAQDTAGKSAVADACLACAEGLAAAGKTAEAAALYAAVGKAAVPKHVQIAALHGQIRLQPSAARELVLQQLRAEDPAFFRVGLAAARVLPGADATAALTGELEKLPAERQALLLRALGDRRDPPPLPTVLAATKSDSPAVREAAISVLARLGDASATTILLDASLGEGGAAAQAKEGLKTLAAADVDGAVLAKLPGADAKAKAILLEIAAARRIAAALPAVREALTARDEDLQLAALAALGQLVEQKDLQLLTTPALAAGESLAKKAAQDALQTAALRMSDRDACAAALGALVPGTSAANQEYLLDLLGKLAGKKALAEVVSLANSSDAALKDVATRVLGEWPDADAADALLEIAKNDREQKFQIRAIRGYIRIARQLQLADDVRLAMFRTAMDVAERNEDKQVALDILSRIPSVETLRISVSYLNNPPLKYAAAEAAVKIATKLVGPEPKAVAEAMQQVVDAKVTEMPADTEPLRGAEKRKKKAAAAKSASQSGRSSPAIARPGKGQFAVNGLPRRLGTPSRHLATPYRLQVGTPVPTRCFVQSVPAALGTESQATLAHTAGNRPSLTASSRWRSTSCTRLLLRSITKCASIKRLRVREKVSLVRLRWLAMCRLRLGNLTMSGSSCSASSRKRATRPTASRSTMSSSSVTTCRTHNESPAIISRQS